MPLGVLNCIFEIRREKELCYVMMATWFHICASVPVYWCTDVLSHVYCLSGLGWWSICTLFVVDYLYMYVFIAFLIVLIFFMNG